MITAAGNSGRSALGRRFAVLRLLLLLSACLALSEAAHAHDPFEITTVGRVDAERLDLVVTMTEANARALLTPAAEGGVASANIRELLRKSQGEPFSDVRPALVATAAQLYAVTSRGRTLRPTQASVARTAEGDAEFRLTFAPVGPGPLRLRAVHLERFGDGYANAVSLTGDDPRAVLGLKVLVASDPVIEAAVAAPPPGAQARPTPGGPSSTLSAARSFLGLGVEHIFTGYDHLLFLAGILIACRGVRSMLAVISCFTLAHSLTLALAALELVSLPGALVEPVIALSIVVVGVMNAARQDDPSHRYWLTFGFGLVHGLGFAGALRDLDVGQRATSILTPLISFNLGVELGQLLLALPALPLLLKLRRLPQGPRGTRVASLLIAVLGAYWFFERTLGG